MSGITAPAATFSLYGHHSFQVFYEIGNVFSHYFHQCNGDWTLPLNLKSTLHFPLLHSVHFPQDITCSLLLIASYLFYFCVILHWTYAFGFSLYVRLPLLNSFSQPWVPWKKIIRLCINMYRPVFNCFFTNSMALTMTIFQNLHLQNILIRPVGYIT